MFAVGALLSIIQAAGVLVMPPSPRYYVLRGKYAEVSTYTAEIRRSIRYNALIDI